MTDSEFERLEKERDRRYRELLNQVLPMCRCWLGPTSETGLTWNEYTGDWEHAETPDCIRREFPELC